MLVPSRLARGPFFSQRPLCDLFSGSQSQSSQGRLVSPFPDAIPDVTRLYRARHLVSMAVPAIEDGGIAVRDGEILATGPWEQLRREHPAASCEDLGEMILMPGLINAHCHLDYTMMRGALFGGHGFTDWIKRLNSIRRSLDPKDYLDAIALGLSELKRWGCTTVFNIESFPEVIPFLPESPIRVWWFLEVMDIRSRLESFEALAGAIGFLERAGTAERWLRHLAARALHRLQGSLRTLRRLRGEAPSAALHPPGRIGGDGHVPRGWGAMRGFLKEIGRPMEDCTGTTPVQLLLAAVLSRKERCSCT